MSVSDYPYRADPDPSDPNRAVRPDTGLQFVRENGIWKNPQTGVPVRTYPLHAEADPSDPKKARRSDTGEDFYLDCPPGVFVPPLPGGQQKPLPVTEQMALSTPAPTPKTQQGAGTSPFPLPTWLIKNPNPPPVKDIPYFNVSAPFDSCLVGSWKSDPVGPNQLGVTGGDGILLAFKADGTQSIDYNGMQPFLGGFGDKNFWIGTAEGHIMTDKGIAKIKSVERSDIVHKYIGANGMTRTNSLSGSLGPAGLGNNPMDQSYQCNEYQLTFKDPGRTFVFKRIGTKAEETPKPSIPVPSPKPGVLPPPSIPDSVRKQCDPKYSEMMREADYKSRDAAMTRHAAETFRSSGMNSKKTAEGDRKLAEIAKGTLVKAISNGDQKTEAELRQQIEEYYKRAELEEASGEYDLQRAASSEQRAQALEQEAEGIRRDAVQECLQKTGGKP